ncbi:MAG: SBBP repeat-containing protein, partial [Candidatus Tectomicrobia bacterium]|nr:SBBP repeat-containing protein [Candidatus Tectomicrobia bacterium]
TKGRAHVTGVTESADFPMINPQQQDLGGNSDAFVAKLTRDGKALAYSTYLGGGGIDEGLGIAVRNGQAHVTGGTTSLDFPMASPLQSTFSGNRDAFVAKLKADGKTLVYSTYLGGSGFDEGTAIAVRKRRAFVSGSTESSNFPLSNPLQGFGGERDVFVTKLKVNGQAFAYSTYLGGSGSDEGLGIAVNRRGRAYVTGETDSLNFPTARPLLGSFNGGNDDAFIVKIK